MFGLKKKAPINGEWNLQVVGHICLKPSIRTIMISVLCDFCGGDGPDGDVDHMVDDYGDHMA